MNEEYKFSYYIESETSNNEIKNIKNKVFRCEEHLYDSIEECIEASKKELLDILSKEKYTSVMESYVHIVRVRKVHKLPHGIIGGIKELNEYLLDYNKSNSLYISKDAIDIYNNLHDEFSKAIHSVYNKHNDWLICEIDNSFIGVYKAITSIENHILTEISSVDKLTSLNNEENLNEYNKLTPEKINQLKKTNPYDIELYLLTYEEFLARTRNNSFSKITDLAYFLDRETAMEELQEYFPTLFDITLKGGFTRDNLVNILERLPKNISGYLSDTHESNRFVLFTNQPDLVKSHVMSEIEAIATVNKPRFNLIDYLELPKRQDILTLLKLFHLGVPKNINGATFDSYTQEECCKALGIMDIKEFNRLSDKHIGNKKNIIDAIKNNDISKLDKYDLEQIEYSEHYYEIDSNIGLMPVKTLEPPQSKYYRALDLSSRHNQKVGTFKITTSGILSLAHSATLNRYNSSVFPSNIIYKNSYEFGPAKYITISSTSIGTPMDSSFNSIRF